MSLKQLCKDKGFTLSETSEKAGISIVYLSKMNCGKQKNPSLEILNKIASCIGVSVNSVIEAISNVNEVNKQ